MVTYPRRNYRIIPLIMFGGSLFVTVCYGKMATMGKAKAPAAGVTSLDRQS